MCLEVCGKEWTILEDSGRKHVEGSRVMYWIVHDLVMDGTVEKVLL